MADISNQWQLVGDCTQCRRKDYCKKECTARKKFRREQTEILVRKYLKELMEKRKEQKEVEGDAESEQQENPVQDAEENV